MPATSFACGQVCDLERPYCRLQPKGYLMKRNRLVLASAVTAVIAILLYSGLPARAELRIDITSGKIEPMPIAIPSFACSGNDEGQAGKQICSGVSADHDLSWR